MTVASAPSSGPSPAVPPAGWREPEEQRLFLLLAGLPEGDRRRGPLRDDLTVRHLALVESLAARYRGRGEPFEDIVQAGRVGLVRAIDRFDPMRGPTFVAYATTMILGEIKRHFRDTTWSVHVPRRLQELRGRLRSAAQELNQAGVTEPSPGQLAAHQGLDEAEVEEACTASNGYCSLSLDTPITDANGLPLAATLGGVDDELERVVDLVALRRLIGNLPERQKTVVQRYFYGNQTQAEIADHIGVSQMHVSRLLRKALDFLRRALTEEPAAQPPTPRPAQPRPDDDSAEKIAPELPPDDHDARAGTVQAHAGPTATTHRPMPRRAPARRPFHRRRPSSASRPHRGRSCRAPRYRPGPPYGCHRPGQRPGRRLLRQIIRPPPPCAHPPRAEPSRVGDTDSRATRRCDPLIGLAA